MRMRQAIGLSLALWAISGIAMAKETVAADDRHHQPESAKTKPVKVEHPAARHASDHHRPADKVARERSDKTARQGASAHGTFDQADDRPAPIHHIAAAAPPDRVIHPKQSAESSAPIVKVVGHQQIGMAAWYGGKHLGRRTASGAVLDNETPTAAHRSLPLNSLVRITNLRTGRSVICTVNDRGPWGRNRLIDVSPRAADELDLKRTGIAKVSVEPVAPVAHPKPD
jgi:rare lipoprotein A